MTVELAVPNKDSAILSYHEASSRFRVAYQYYREYHEAVILETRNMFNALKSVGYTSKAAINKIKDDHKDLKGFSKSSIYSNLPDEVKIVTRPKKIPENVRSRNLSKTLPSPEVRTVEGIENDGDIVTDAQPLQQDSKATANQTTEFTAEPDELSQTQPRSQMQQQPEPSTSTDAHPMIAKPTAVISKEWEIWDIETEGREIKRLDKYDKGSLIIIIKKLHTERKNLAEELWQKEITSVKEDLTLLKELETENAKLKQNILELDKLHDESTKLNTDIQKALKTEIQELENENADLKKQVEAVKPFVELFSGLNPEEMESWLQFMKNALEREKELRK